MNGPAFLILCNLSVAIAAIMFAAMALTGDY